MTPFTPRYYARCTEPACSDQSRFQCTACGAVSCERHSTYCARCARLRLRFILLCRDYWTPKTAADADQAAACIKGEV